MTKKELKEKAQELTIKNVTNGKSKYYSWGFHTGCVVGLEYNNNRIAELEEALAEEKLYCEFKCYKWKKTREDLEKENAELKKQLGMSNKVYNDNLDYSHHIEGQLTKAKKLLKQFLEAKNGEDTYKAEWEAQQFLKEVEK